MSKFEEKTISKKEIFKGKIISVSVDEVELSDGLKVKREIVEHPGAVAVLALNNAQQILLVKQYRKPIEGTLIELPAGKIEPNELPEITAKRELEEETGYTTNYLEYVTSFYTSPGFANEVIHLYFANRIEQLTKKVSGDADENIELLYLTLEEAKSKLKKEKINDAKTMIALQYLELIGNDIT